MKAYNVTLAQNYYVVGTKRVIVIDENEDMTEEQIMAKAKELAALEEEEYNIDGRRPVMQFEPFVFPASVIIIGDKLIPSINGEDMKEFASKMLMQESLLKTFDLLLAAMEQDEKYSGGYMICTHDFTKDNRHMQLIMSLVPFSVSKLPFGVVQRMSIGSLFSKADAEKPEDNAAPPADEPGIEDIDIEGFFKKDE